ncbi:MAG: hypothetical protein QNJ41_06700 [Xenococcaceae cyanobacterium MO_188.B32]|nr:hypothetical protein [Xenococcaceae cyanobacterium MO_188.B32]
MKITRFINNILRKIGRSLVVQNNEPIIKQKRDRYGNCYWQIYDFTTNKFYDFGSEQDVRAWIEQRYHGF